MKLSLLFFIFITSLAASRIEVETVAPSSSFDRQFNHERLYEQAKLRWRQLSADHGKTTEYQCPRYSLWPYLPDYLILIDLDSRKLAVVNGEDVSEACLIRNLKVILDKKRDSRPLPERITKLNQKVLDELFQKCRIVNSDERNEQGVIFIFVCGCIIFLAAIFKQKCYHNQERVIEAESKVENDKDVSGDNDSDTSDSWSSSDSDTSDDSSDSWSSSDDSWSSSD